mmetsp:Transcript_44978/g.88277  ORF Transcript_44978/g.88277 Transcript_44978/m.88277 type:complete len:221 (-) Transcript_44978:385-1047(-)
MDPVLVSCFVVYTLVPSIFGPFLDDGHSYRPLPAGRVVQRAEVVQVAVFVLVLLPHVLGDRRDHLTRWFLPRRFVGLRVHVVHISCRFVQVLLPDIPKLQDLAVRFVPCYLLVLDIGVEQVTCVRVPVLFPHVVVGDDLGVGSLACALIGFVVDVEGQACDRIDLLLPHILSIERDDAACARGVPQHDFGLDVDVAQHAVVEMLLPQVVIDVGNDLAFRF